MNEKKMEELLNKAKKLQEENPEEFAKQVELAKEQFGGDENIQEKLNQLDEDKKDQLLDLLNQVQTLKTTTPEERAKLVQEMKNQLNPEDQKKLSKTARLLKGLLKNK